MERVAPGMPGEGDINTDLKEIREGPTQRAQGSQCRFGGHPERWRAAPIPSVKQDVRAEFNRSLGERRVGERKQCERLRRPGCQARGVSAGREPEGAAGIARDAHAGARGPQAPQPATPRSRPGPYLPTATCTLLWAHTPNSTVHTSARYFLYVWRLREAFQRGCACAVHGGPQFSVRNAGAGRALACRPLQVAGRHRARTHVAGVREQRSLRGGLCARGAPASGGAGGAHARGGAGAITPIGRRRRVRSGC